MSPTMWFSMSSLFLALFLSFLLLILLHLSSLLISLFIFSFPSSATPHPIFVSLFFPLLLFFLSLSPFHMSSHCLLPLILLIPHNSLSISHKTLILLLQYVPFHLLYLLTYQNLFSIASHLSPTLIPWWLDQRLGFINQNLLWQHLILLLNLPFLSLYPFAKQSNMLTRKMVGLQNTRLLLKIILGH